jgi:hypothetical protein
LGSRHPEFPLPTGWTHESILESSNCPAKIQAGGSFRPVPPDHANAKCWSTAMNNVSAYLEERIKSWPREKQDEARRGFAEFLSGVVQSLVGNVRRGFVNKFLDTIGPVEKIEIEFIADHIVDAKDSHRLRQKTLIGLVAAFESGIKYAVEATHRRENPLGIIELLHKNILTHEAAISGKSDSEKERMIETWRNETDEG